MGSIRNYTLIDVKLVPTHAMDTLSVNTMGIILLDYTPVLVNQSQITVNVILAYDFHYYIVVETLCANCIGGPIKCNTQLRPLCI